MWKGSETGGDGEEQGGGHAWGQEKGGSTIGSPTAVLAGNGLPTDVQKRRGGKDCNRYLGTVYPKTYTRTYTHATRIHTYRTFLGNPCTVGTAREG